MHNCFYFFKHLHLSPVYPFKIIFTEEEVQTKSDIVAI